MNKKYFGTFIALRVIHIILVLALVCELHSIRTDGIPSNVTGSHSSGDDVTTEQVSYDTNIKEWIVNTKSGESFTFNTPSGYYSLSDQYLSNLQSYYQTADSVHSDSMVVVGNSTSPYSSTNVINADSLSDISNILQQMYGDSYDESTMAQSEAYVYMTTGKLPEELPDNYEIEEVTIYTVNGTEFVVYEVNYDTTYTDTATTTEEGEEAEPITQTVHTQNLTCYSKTDDSVEVVLFMQEFDREQGLELLKEFFGVKE